MIHFCKLHKKPIALSFLPRSPCLSLPYSITINSFFCQQSEFINSNVMSCNIKTNHIGNNANFIFNIKSFSVYKHFFYSYSIKIYKMK